MVSISCRRRRSVCVSVSQDHLEDSFTVCAREYKCWCTLSTASFDACQFSQRKLSLLFFESPLRRIKKTCMLVPSDVWVHVGLSSCRSLCTSSLIQHAVCSCAVVVPSGYSVEYHCPRISAVMIVDTVCSVAFVRVQSSLLCQITLVMHSALWYKSMFIKQIFFEATSNVSAANTQKSMPSHLYICCQYK